ncbi:MAG: hypothetical protein ACK6DM_10230 [Alphaproteobacteria bacterium]|jgi:hypothetical protein
MLERLLAPNSARVVLILFTYVCAALLVHPALFVYRMGELGLYFVIVVWAISICALLIWHVRRALIVSPQLLVVANVVIYFSIQQNCISEGPCWFGF